MKQTVLLLLMIFSASSLGAMDSDEDISPLHSPTQRRRVSQDEDNKQAAAIEEQSINDILGDPHECSAIRGAATVAGGGLVSYGAFRLWMVCWNSLQHDQQ